MNDTLAETQMVGDLTHTKEQPKNLFLSESKSGSTESEIASLGGYSAPDIAFAGEQPMPQLSEENQDLKMREIARLKEMFLQEAQKGTTTTTSPEYMPATMMNPVSVKETEVSREIPPAKIVSSPIKKIEDSKGPWLQWSEFDIIKFIRNLEIKAKLDTLVKGVKNVLQAPFKAFGRFYTKGDAPRITTSTRTPILNP